MPSNIHGETWNHVFVTKIHLTGKRLFCFPSNLAHQILKVCVHCTISYTYSMALLTYVAKDNITILKLACHSMKFSLYLIAKLNLKDIKSTDVWIRNIIKTQIIPPRRHLQSSFKVSFPSEKRALFTTLSHVYRDLWVRVDFYLPTIFKAGIFDLVCLFMWLENEKKIKHRSRETMVHYTSVSVVQKVCT